MKLNKELVIEKLEFTNFVNAPCKIFARSDNLESTFIVKDNFTKDVIGKKILLTLESKEFKGFGENNVRSFEKDIVLIGSIRREEKTNFTLSYFRDSDKFSETKMILTLQSPSTADGIHPSPMPCPYYEISLQLTEDEYSEVCELPANAVMKLSFTVK